MMRHCIDLMNKSGKITTEACGLENLPETGGYIMYPNHQGKYDLLGIITTPVSYTHLLPLKSLALKLVRRLLLIRF